MNERKGSVATDVEQGIDIALSVLDDNEGVASDVVGDIVSGLFKLQAVRHEHPRLAEDGSSLELVEYGLPIPRCRKGALFVRRS